MDTESKKISSDLKIESSADGLKKPEKKSSLRLKKIQLMMLLALAGTLLTSCGVVESRAKANIEAAGVPPAVANDPDLIWEAENGATAEELRDYANSLMMKRSVELNQAMETQDALDAENTEEAEQSTQQQMETPVQEQEFSLEQIVQGVYSFSTQENLEVTNQAFFDRVKKSIGKLAGSDVPVVFVAVMDDVTGVEEIFMDSNIGAYKDSNGAFYAYVGDTVYVSTSSQELSQFLDSKGITHHTFGLP